MDGPADVHSVMALCSADVDVEEVGLDVVVVAVVVVVVDGPA